jgi:hypothetical protein
VVFECTRANSYALFQSQEIKFSSFLATFSHLVI